MTTPPPSSSWTCVTRPSPSVYRSCSRKPKAFVSQSAAAPMSSYESMGTIVGSRSVTATAVSCCMQASFRAGQYCRQASLVLDECDLCLSGGDGAARQALREELGRRRSRELAEVAVEMRLVVVAAVVGDLGPALLGLAAEQAKRPVEAEDASDRLRRQADLPAELRRKVAAAASELARERADLDPAGGLLQPLPGTHDVGGERPRVEEPAREEPVEKLEARLPRGRIAELPRQEARGRAERVLELDRPVRERVHRRSEDAVRGERAQAHLETGRLRARLDDGVGVVEARDEGVARLRRPPLVGGIDDPPRRAEVEDQRDLRDRHLLHAKGALRPARPALVGRDDVTAQPRVS